MKESLIVIESRKLQNQMNKWIAARKRGGQDTDSVDQIYYLFNRLAGARARIKQLQRARYKASHATSKKGDT